MKLDDIKALNLPHYKHDPNSREIIIGDAVAEAWIASTADALTEGYSWGEKDNKYHQTFRQGVSQHEDSRYPGSKDQPKDFPVLVIGIVEEGKTHNLAYATSRNHKTKKITTLRVTNLEQISEIWNYRLILKKDSSHSRGL